MKPEMLLVVTLATPGVALAPSGMSPNMSPSDVDARLVRAAADMQAVPDQLLQRGAKQIEMSIPIDARTQLSAADVVPAVRQQTGGGDMGKPALAGASAGGTLAAAAASYARDNKRVNTVHVLAAYSTERVRYFAEGITFTRANCLLVHRPLGSVMRAPPPVYKELGDPRRRENGVAPADTAIVTDIRA